jgi:hypothetical protein
MVKFSSVFTYSGNPVDTLNTLTKVENVDVTKTLEDLSKDNYAADADQVNTKPNAANQLIFMNQPMSWWLTNLNSGKVRYMAFSKYVNWVYVPSEPSMPQNVAPETPMPETIRYHIDMSVSSLFIPNMPDKNTRDLSMNMTVTFKPLLNMGRTDTHSR